VRKIPRHCLLLLAEAILQTGPGEKMNFSLPYDSFLLAAKKASLLFT
jgi:hypothetical protein